MTICRKRMCLDLYMHATHHLATWVLHATHHLGYLNR